ncbi:hypothetical protein [Hymenobacter cavernae]|uniref:Uncharacterized protein n=1 Tax=Hymenobacter cavernae TaxID=2044852 RepID=A0ABQ1UNI5_9BACT|nr:hypothetical protein [Hymenobacter cavernae]GGF22647.1 hypothetical protein GCM10011383_37860 [Hymenobacter cavernae]
MKTFLSLLLCGALLSACSKDNDPKDGIDPTWYTSPTNRLQLVVPSKYGPPQDSVAVIFRNPDQVKVRYHFLLRRYTGPNFVQIADAHTRLLNPNETQQINYSTLPTGAYTYGQDAIHVVLENADTKEMYGDFVLTSGE